MKTVVYLSHYVSAELFMNQEKKGISWVCPIGILKRLEMLENLSHSSQTPKSLNVSGDLVFTLYTVSCKPYEQIVQRIYCCSSIFPSLLFPFSAFVWSAFLFPSIILTAAWCQAAGICSVICVWVCTFMHMFGLHANCPHRLLFACGCVLPCTVCVCVCVAEVYVFVAHLLPHLSPSRL